MSVDLYATPETRDKLIKKLNKSPALIKEKRAACKDYCTKFLDHLQLMRKDLLNLVSNEDAVSLHEEIRGITESMRAFGIGLEDSVTKEPTQINLADWANLCLFRLAIIRRKVGTAKIYIDKTGSGETLYKIEAFLYTIFQFLNTGELDEYELEMIENDEFFDVGFLASQSSIVDPVETKPAAYESDDDDEEVEPAKVEEVKEEKPVKRKKKKDRKRSRSKSANKSPSTPALASPSSDDAEPEKSPPAEDKSVPDPEPEPPKSNPTDEKSSDSTEEPDDVLVQSAPTVIIESKSEEEPEIETRKKAPNSEKIPRRNKPDNVPRIRPSGKIAECKSSDGVLLSDRGHLKPAVKDRLNATAKRSNNSTNSTRISGLSLVHSIQSQRNSVVTPGRSKRSIAFSRRRRSHVPSLLPPIIIGRLCRLQGTGAKKAYKPRWAVLNGEKFEFYKDEKCNASSLGTAIPVGIIEQIKIRTPEEDKEAENPEAETEFLFSVVYLGGELFLCAPDRITMLQWILMLSGLVQSIKAIEGKDTGPVVQDHEKLVKEVYVDSYGTESAIKLGEGEKGEQWIYLMGKVMCVGKKVQYFWDGLSLKPQGGDNLGQATWNGLSLVWSSPDKPNETFIWNQCVSEFQAIPDDDGEVNTIWIWNKEGFVKSVPPAPDGVTPKLWKFLTPIPPPVIMCIELLSVALNPEAEIQPQAVVQGESISARSERRRKNKIQTKIRASGTLRAASLTKIFRNKPSKSETVPDIEIPEDSKSSEVENKFSRAKSKSPRDTSRSPRADLKKAKKKEKSKESKENFESGPDPVSQDSPKNDQPAEDVKSPPDASDQPEKDQDQPEKKKKRSKKAHS